MRFLGLRVHQRFLGAKGELCGRAFRSGYWYKPVG